MNLRRVNQFTPLPLPCSALPGAWNWPCRRHSGLVVWAVYIVRIRFRTAWKILFRRILRCDQRVPYWLRVLHLCCWQSIHILFRDGDYTLGFFLSNNFHDCIIFTFCWLVSHVVSWNCVIFTCTTWEFSRMGCTFFYYFSISIIISFFLHFMVYFCTS